MTTFLLKRYLQSESAMDDQSSPIDHLVDHYLRDLHKMDAQITSLIKSLTLLKLVCQVSPQKIDFSGRGMLTVLRKYLLMQQDLPMKLMLD